MARTSIFAASLFGLTALGLAPTATSQADETIGTYGVERGSGRVICTGDADGRGERQAPLDESYARAALWDQLVLGKDAAPCARKAPVFEAIDEGVWQRTSAFTGVDAAGRSADMRIYVLEDRFSWSFGSSRNIEEETGAPAQFSYIFGRPMFLGEFCQGDAAASLGAASFEGDAENNRVLARNRAQTLGDQMQRLAGFCDAQESPPSLHGINLGEFTAETPCMRDGTCSGSQTSPQRRVVLLGIQQAEADINLAEAVRNAMTQPIAQSVLSVEDYDVFEFMEF